MRAKRDLHGLAGTVGVTCVDVNGDVFIGVPSLQGARLDHPEVMASCKCKHCPACEIASKEQLGQHPSRRPMRDAVETERLVLRAIDAQHERADALAASPVDMPRRRRALRRLKRLKAKLKRRGLYLRTDSNRGRLPLL